MEHCFAFTIARQARQISQSIEGQASKCQHSDGGSRRRRCQCAPAGVCQRPERNLDPLTYCVTTSQELVSDSVVLHGPEVTNACIGKSGADDLMTVRPETIEADFKTAAIGTLVAGQWFAKNANISNVNQGEYPLLLVTGGVLHQVCPDQCKNVFGRLMLTATIPVILHYQQSNLRLRILPPISL
jgi:hypothetical protein